MGKEKKSPNYDVFLFLRDVREEVGLSYFAKINNVRRTQVILSGFKAVFTEGRASQKQLRGFQKQLKEHKNKLLGFQNQLEMSAGRQSL